ncbi:hypothetical protein [Variovorax sp. CY25R-8]|jgi:hypothetical protein|uniref:hypothetical protein n=1 Tax=Variovorax sp. CY25R-8 TaxID=2855501 RepID=UPI0021BA469F|nr:hypothetical protein [Variovorax sp. CY25R-8]MCT8178115.1 hypothetical protein [Variovorax sp. CY25R-8]
MADKKMTCHQIDLNDAEHAMLDRVRRAKGLDTIADTVVWLAKARLRKGVENITGRRRGPRLVASGGKSK